MPETGVNRAARIVVAATGQGDRARIKARALLMSGYEVVFLGGDQSPDQIAWTAVAEDAGAVVIDANDRVLAAVDRALGELTCSEVHITSCAQVGAEIRTE